MDVGALIRRGGGTAWPSSVRLLGHAVPIALLTGVAMALGAASGSSAPAATALLRGALVAGPLVAASYALRRPEYARFGRLLLAVGLAGAASTLAESPDPALYSVGRAAGWLNEVLLVIVVLAFPTGRLTARIDRRLAAAMAAVVALLFLPTLITSPTFPVPSPYTSCMTDCPANAFYPFDGALTAFSPFDVGAVLVFGLMVAVVVRLQGRCTQACDVRRALLVPLLAVATARAALMGAGTLSRLLDGDVLAEACFVAVAVATPLLAVAFLAGLMRLRLFEAAALREMAALAQGPADLPALERGLARALHDPSVRVVTDAPCGRGPGHAELVCAPDLAEQKGLIDAGSAIADVALQNLRLRARTEATERELHHSRARLAATADRERRRIERDLHDGAQQRLVALRIELGLLEDLVVRDPQGSLERIRELERHAEEALEELRSLAHGVRPPLLDDRGLVAALQAATARSLVPAQLHARDVGRYAPELESAVYFCVVEALQNVAKHARAAHRAEVRIDGGDDGLQFSVRDDGPGADRDVLAQGLTSMRDRLAAVGGALSVVSRPGLGTTVRGRVPPRTPAPR